MRSARGIAPLVLAVALATGCTDTTRPEASVNAPAIAPPQTSAHYTEIGPQAAPAGATAEWTAATWISVRAAVGFYYDAVSPDEGVPGNVRSTAWGQAIINYLGNEADGSVTLTVRKNGSMVSQTSAQASERHLFPYSYSFSAYAQIPVAAPCGYTAEAAAVGEAWNRAIIPPVGWMEWGRKKDSEVKTAAQPPCESGAPPSSGSGTVEQPASDGGNCPWHRDFVVFPDGSWRWLTSWYRSCTEYELGIAHDGPTDIANGISSPSAAKSASSAPMKLTIVGVVGTGNGQITTIERSGKANTDARIVIDLARATAADLEEAFVSAEALTLKAKPKDPKSAYGQVNGAASDRSRAAAVEGSRAATNLSALRAAAEGQRRSGTGTSIDVVVNRRP